MKKFRITITTINEYEVTEESLKTIYGGVDNFEDALQLDIGNAKDDPYIFMEMEEAKTEVKGEIL